MLNNPITWFTIGKIRPRRMLKLRILLSVYKQVPLAMLPMLNY